MFEQFIFLLAALTLLLFAVNVLYNGNGAKSCLIFILVCLPLMNLKITSEAYGGFKTFDFICFYCLIFLLKDFLTIDLRKQENFYFLLFLGLCIILIIGGLASEFPERTWINFFRFLSIFIFARFFLISCFRDHTFHASAINALKLSYFLSILFLAAQLVFGLDFTFYPKLGPNTIDPVFKMVRFPGIFYDSQANGQYLAMGSFLFLYVADGEKKSWRIINYSIFLCVIIGLALAGSRAPIGGFIIGVLVTVFVLSGKYRIYGALVIALAIAAYFIVAPNFGIFERVDNLSEDYLFRKNLWDEAFEISKSNPLLGIGSGNYQDYILWHNQNQYIEIEDDVFLYFDQPENGYLKVLVEFGFIGFGIFLVMLIIPLVKGLVGYINGLFDAKIILLVASLISWLVAFNTVYSIADYRILIVVTAIILLIISYPTKQNANDVT